VNLEDCDSPDRLPRLRNRSFVRSAINNETLCAAMNGRTNTTEAVVASYDIVVAEISLSLSLMKIDGLLYMRCGRTASIILTEPRCNITRVCRRRRAAS